MNQADTQTAVKTHRMTKAEINSLNSTGSFERGKSNPFADHSTTSTGGSGSSGSSTSGSSGSSAGGKIFDNPDEGMGK